MDNWQAWLTVAVLLLALGQLAFTRIPPDIALLGAVAVLMLTGVLAPHDALSGLANEGVATVALLFVVSAGMTETGGITWIAERIFGRPRTPQRAIARLTIPAATASAFMNNTPLVAMLIPAVNDWAKQIRVAASKLMIPLSYAAILGGTCTLIGTSTNIVVNGLVIEAAKTNNALPRDGLGMFDITWIGVPACLVGLAFIIGLSRWLLPDRRAPISDRDDPRQYTVEMAVTPDSPLAGKTIEEAGLRHLQGVFLAEINRDSQVLPAVSPQERLRPNDLLVFVGVVDSVVDLRKIRGLAPATDEVAKIAVPSRDRCLIEAVVSNSCPIVGKTIRDGRFRTKYDAAVIAVARNGERINKKIGDIVLQPGDTLLLESHPSFADRERNSRDFFLVSRLENSTPPQHEKAVIAIIILAGLVIALASDIPTVIAALGAAAAMLITGCASIAAARRAIDWETLLAIVAAFALGKALETTGAAASIGSKVIELAVGDPWMALALVYAVTLVVTELITNNAAAALMFPLAMSTAQRLGASYYPFIIAVMMAASAGFATPIGYQTNLMVYGPGGYRFSDYLKIGVPLDILVGIVTVLLAPLVFPF